MTTAAIGFIGLGRMGKPMALNLLRAGFDVSVVSRSRPPIDELVAAGAHEAPSLATLAQRASIICTCLPDLAASRDIYLGSDGLIPNARPGQTLIETSTISPSLARQIAEAAAARGAGYLDAPVSGGVERAQNATLAIMAGGDDATFNTARPALDAIGSAVHHVGAAGQGSVVKLANQLLVGVHTLAACEAFAFGTAAEVNAAQMLDILAASWGASNMLARNGPLFRSGDYGSLAPVRLLAKDLALVEESAHDLGVALPIAQRARALFDEAMQLRLGECDISALITMIRPPARPA